MIYPVHRRDGQHAFKLLVHMTDDELNEVSEDLRKKRSGLDQHMRALTKIRETLNGVWATEPSLTIEEAQARLYGAAA